MSIDQSSLAKGQIRKLNAHVWFSIAAGMAFQVLCGSETLSTERSGLDPKRIPEI